MTANVVSKLPDRRTPHSTVKPAVRAAESRPAPLVKPTGPLVYTVSKGADVFPTARKG